MIIRTLRLIASEKFWSVMIRKAPIGLIRQRYKAETPDLVWYAKSGHWIGQWPRQTGKLEAAREMAAQAKEQGHEVWGWDPKAGLERDPEWLFPKTQEPTMETGGPAGAAFTPMMVRPTNDATTLAFNTMRSELLKLAQQYDEWAVENQAEASMSRTNGLDTPSILATEYASMAGQLRQIARGRQ